LWGRGRYPSPEQATHSWRIIHLITFLVMLQTPTNEVSRFPTQSHAVSQSLSC
jgi:hypothetical protein